MVIRNRWSGEIPEEWNYEFTELDDMPPGWRIAFGIQMLEEIREELIKNNCLDSFRITQIKEKYGGLRFYVYGAPSAVYKIIDKYEGLSYHVCQFCGAPAEVENSWGWIMTWCENCKEKITNRINRINRE